MDVLAVVLHDVADPSIHLHVLVDKLFMPRQERGTGEKRST